MDTPPHPDISSRRAAYWLAVLVLVALALRLYRLGVEPLWHDEVFELVQVEDFWDTLFTGANVSSHPPLYVILMKGTEALGLHATEWGVRILAALLGVLTVPAVYLTASLLFTRRIGLVAAGIVAVSVFHIVHSQDAKSYILLPLVGTLLVYASLRAWEEGGRWWPLYTVLAALAFYSQAFAVPLLIVLNGWYFVEALLQKRPLRAWFVANVAAFLLVLPWIVIMMRKAGDVMVAAENWWIPTPGLVELAFAIKTMAFGYGDHALAFRIATAGCAVLAVAGAASLYRTYPRHTALVVLWFALPIALLFGVSQVANSIFLYRALMPFAIALYILIAAGLLVIPRMPLRIGAGALLFAATLPSLSDHYFQTYSSRFLPHRPGIHLPIDYDLAADLILEHWLEGDCILLNSGASMLPLYAYGIRGESMRMRTTSVSIDHLEYIRRSHPPLVLANPLFRDYYGLPLPGAAEGARRIWFVFSDWEQEFLQYSGLDTWRWMDARYTEVAHHAWRGIEVFLYEAEDPPTVVFRDLDDGVRAEHFVQRVDGTTAGHEKFLPDAGAVRRPLRDRMGALELAWQGESAFAITNHAAAAAEFTVHVVHSAGMLPIAAWVDEELGKPWQVQAWYHTHPPPAYYELATATCALEPGDSSVLTGAIPAAFASLNPALLGWMGPNEDEPTRRLRITLSIGGAAAAIEWLADFPGWHWSPLHFEASPAPGEDGALSVAFEVEAIHPDFTSYANLAYLALSHPDYPVHAEVRAGEFLEPQEERLFTLDTLSPRTDVWVFEQGDEGRVYRIFRVQP